MIRPLYLLSVICQLLLFWLFMALYFVTIIPLAVIVAAIGYEGEN
jgi:hypothetical protein